MTVSGKTGVCAAEWTVAASPGLLSSLEFTWHSVSANSAAASMTHLSSMQGCWAPQCSHSPAVPGTFVTESEPDLTGFSKGGRPGRWSQDGALFPATMLSHCLNTHPAVVHQLLFSQFAASLSLLPRHCRGLCRR